MRKKTRRRLGAFGLCALMAMSTVVSGYQTTYAEAPGNAPSVDIPTLAKQTSGLMKEQLYTDETNLASDWNASKVECTTTDVAGNTTNKISMGADSSIDKVIGVMKTGHVKMDYEMYNSGSANAFIIQDKDQNALINIGGAGSGNMNIMPEKETSGKVSQWVKKMPKTWVKVEIDIDLDSSNASGVLDFTMNVYKTSTHAGADTNWELVKSLDESIYTASTGQENGSNGAAPHANGAATEGISNFNIAGIQIINAGSSAVYYDNMSVEADDLQSVRTLESTNVTGSLTRTEYPVGAGIDLSGIKVMGTYKYTNKNGTTDELEREIKDYDVDYDFSKPGVDVPVTLQIKDGEKTFKHVLNVTVTEIDSANYLSLNYKDQDTLDDIKLTGNKNASVNSGAIDALDESNTTNKIQINKGTASVDFGQVFSEGTVHFETEFLTQATSKASLFFRLVNSEGLPLVDIGQYGSSNMNMYLDRKTSGTTAGTFKKLPVQKWAKASIDIDLNASKEAGHLVFRAIVWITDDQASGEWTEFARFDQSLYLDSTTAPSATGAASTALTLFDVAGVEFCNAGGTANFYDNVSFEGVGKGTSKVLDKLEIVSLPNKTEYTVGDSFVNTGLSLMGTYKYTFADGTTDTVKKEVIAYDVDFDNMVPAKESMVTITADGKSVQFPVKVKQNPLLDGLAEYIVSFINNDLVTMNEDGTINLNKRNIRLPSFFDSSALSYSTDSEGATIENNILSVTPSTEKQTTVKLNIVLNQTNAEGDAVELATAIDFIIPKASSDVKPTTALVTEEDFKNAINTLIKNGVISGESRIAAESIMENLDSNIKTEEFVSMLMRTFDVDVSYTDTVIDRTDVDYKAWYAEDIIAAFQLGIEPEEGRTNKTTYGIGEDLTAEDATDLVDRMESVDQTKTGGVSYQMGLPAQSDSSEFLVPVLDPMSDLLAFPGADGFAKNVTGGRGGKIIHVTNLNSSGEGSFLAALYNNGNKSEPRIIVFDVAGTIDWTRNDAIENYKMLELENVTIAGQTAPGNGISLINGSFYFAHSSNMIIRFVNFRHGQATAKDDSCFVENSENIMIDHCSFAYGSDESMSARYNSNLSIQWSIIANGVRTHSMGGLQEWNTENISHCLIGDQNDRNPKAKGIMDFTNNVLYNWGEYGFVAGGNSGGACWANVIGNYFIAGLDSKYPSTPICRSNGKYMLYQAQNLVDSNKNGVLDGVNTGIDMVNNDGGDFAERYTYKDLPLTLIKNKMNMSNLSSIDSAETAYNKVTTYVGSSVSMGKDGTTTLDHNDVDTEIINGVKNQTGKLLLSNAESYNEDGVHFDEAYFNNYPSDDVNDVNSIYYASRIDSDQDGMPDAWENKMGLNPNDAQDRNNIAASGYTYIEEYLNELAAPAFPEEGEDASVEQSTQDRNYEMTLDYGKDTKTWQLYQTENNLMVPLAPVLEYLGFNVTRADSEMVTAEYPYPVNADNKLNLDTVEGVHNVTPGTGTFDFSSSWTNFNDVATVYNDTIYVPITMVALTLGGVYEQKITDQAQNKAQIDIQDAEVYKNWFEGSEIRNTRKTSAPLVDYSVNSSELRLLFDKEAAINNSDAVITLVDDKGVVYTAPMSKAVSWGSHKVFSLNWSDFTTDAGKAFTWNNAANYTITISEGAIKDYYNSTLFTSEITGTINTATDVVAEVTVPASQAPANKAPENKQNELVTETPAASDETAMETVRMAIQTIYDLFPVVSINKTNYDMIDTNSVVSKVELQNAIDKADKVVATGYTSDSYAALQKAVAAAKLIAGKEDASQEEVNAANTALLSAIDALVKNSSNIGNQNRPTEGQTTAPTQENVADKNQEQESDQNSVPESEDQTTVEISSVDSDEAIESAKIDKAAVVKDDDGNVIALEAVHVKAVATESAKNNINAALTDNQIVLQPGSTMQAFDIKLVDANGNKLVLENGYVKITFAYAEGINADDYDVKVYHLAHNGVLEPLEVELTANGINAKATGFSDFVVIYEPKQATEPADGSQIAQDNVQSGDHSPVMFYMLLVAMALLGMGYVAVKSLKSNKQK